jgi:nicotinamidase-related amidase
MLSGSSRWLALDKKVQPAHTALLVIDMQNDFIASVGLVGRSGRDVSAAQKLAERLPDFIAAARRAGVLVVFVRIRPTAIFIYRIPGSNRVAGSWQ